MSLFYTVTMKDIILVIRIEMGVVMAVDQDN